jgi:hypothetical protein
MTSTPLTTQLTRIEDSLTAAASILRHQTNPTLPTITTPLIHDLIQAREILRSLRNLFQITTRTQPEPPITTTNPHHDSQT